MKKVEIQVLDRDLAWLQDKIQGTSTHERIVPQMDEAWHKEIEQEALRLHQQIETMSQKDPVEALLKSHFQDFLEMILFAWKNQKEDPGYFIDRLFSVERQLNTRDSRLKSIRDEILAIRQKQANQIAQNLAASVCLLKDSALLHLFSSLQKAPADWDCLKQAVDFQIKERSLQPHGKVLQPHERLIVDQALYKERLQAEFGIEVEELLTWHQEEIEKTRTAMLSLASQLTGYPVASVKEVNQLLEKYAGAYPNAETMMEMGKKCLEKVRKISYEIIPLPEEKCLLTTVPEELKDYFPWGGYMDGCFYHRPPTGTMFLNDQNYQAVSDGWIKVNSIHEAYFGHHIQFVKTLMDPLPETIRRGAKADPISEGVPHRSEEKYAYIFEDSPWFLLFVAYRRHHTAVRIKADLWLRWFGKTIKEVTDLYQQELDFDYDTARGQVQAQENMFGYFTSYYTAVKEILQLEEELQFERDEYTNLLFDAGRISLKNLRRFLLLSPQDRERYKHDYPSLLMD